MNEGYLSYEKGVVLAHYTGMYTAKHAQETTHDIITYLHENNCQSLLLHFEDTQMKLGLSDCLQ